MDKARVGWVPGEEGKFLAKIVQSIVDEMGRNYTVDAGEFGDHHVVTLLHTDCKFRVSGSKIYGYWKGCKVSTDLHDPESVKVLRSLIKRCLDGACDYCEFYSNRKEQLSPNTPLKDGCLIRDGKIYEV